MQGGVFGATRVGLGGLLSPKTFYFIDVTPLLNFIFKVGGCMYGALLNKQNNAALKHILVAIPLVQNIEPLPQSNIAPI